MFLGALNCTYFLEGANGTFKRIRSPTALFGTGATRNGRYFADLHYGPIKVASTYVRRSIHRFLRAFVYRFGRAIFWFRKASLFRVLIRSNGTTFVAWVFRGM